MLGCGPITVNRAEQTIKFEKIWKVLSKKLEIIILRGYSRIVYLQQNSDDTTKVLFMLPNKGT